MVGNCQLSSTSLHIILDTPLTVARGTHAPGASFTTICVVDLEKGSLGMAIQFSDYDFITTIDVLTCYVVISSSVVQHMTKF